MKKIFIFLGIILIGLTLSACTGDKEITIPTYSGVLIDGSSPETAGELVTFYKAKNNSVKVEISLTNPSNATISSVVINGYKYFSARFNEDSTNKLVSFNLNTGTNLGEKIYSIDEIFYEDGSLSKSVVVSSNNTFKIHTYKNVPTVERENYDVLNDSLQVQFSIEDLDSVIVPGSLVAELYSGETKIDQIGLSTGHVTAEFNDLSSNNLYEVKVRASYDLDDNIGLNNNVLLFSSVFVTTANSTPVAIISNATVASDYISFNVSYTDTNNVTIDGSIYVGVFKDDVLEEMFYIQGNITGATFRNLLSNQEYEVKVLSGYNLKDGSGDVMDKVLYTYSFTTLESFVPVPQIINLVIQENRVSFDISIDDPAGVIDKDTLIAKLYIDGELKQTAPIDEYEVDFQLYNLLSGFDFTVEIEASYDLNDGSPVRTDQIIFTREFTTTEKTVPTVNVSDVIAKQGYVILNLNVEDPNSTIQSALVATLYENDEPVETIQFDTTESELVFNYLIQYQQIYSVDITGSYNLQDGYGAKTGVNLFKTVLVTEKQKAPVAEYNNLINDAVSIELDVRVMDSDETIINDMIQISLYNSGILVESKSIQIGSNHVVFEGLMSNAEYWVIATADYEVNDGSGVVTGVQINSQLVTTTEKAIPGIEINELVVDTDSVTIYYNLLDDDRAIVPGTFYALLTLNNVPVGNPWPLDELGNTAEITGLTSGLRYQVDIFADYDLNDGVTYKTGYLLISSPTPIPARKVIPEATIENITSDNNSITFDATVIDEDDSIIDNLKAVLFKDGEITSHEIDLVPGSNNDPVTLDNLEFGVEYELKVIADYTYNDGTPPFMAEELASEVVSTVPLVIIENVIENDESISYTARIDDVFDISDSSMLEVAVYDQGDNLVGSVRTIHSGTTLNLFNLWSDYDYYVVVKGSYDGVNGEVCRYDFHTQAKVIQPLVISNLELTVNSVKFSVNGVQYPDPSNVITNTAFVKLYRYSEYDEKYLLVQSRALTTGNNDLTFSIYDVANSEYVIQIEATINLNDSYGEITDYIIHSQSFIYNEKNLAEEE